MPAKTPKQQRFMGMCSTQEGRKKAKDKCPPASLAKEFSKKPEGGYKKSKRATKAKKPS